MTCKECGAKLLLANGYMVCERGCGRLLPTESKDRSYFRSTGRVVEVRSFRDWRVRR